MTEKSVREGMVAEAKAAQERGEKVQSIELQDVPEPILKWMVDNNGKTPDKETCKKIMREAKRESKARERKA